MEEQDVRGPCSPPKLERQLPPAQGQKQETEFSSSGLNELDERTLVECEGLRTKDEALGTSNDGNLLPTTGPKGKSYLSPLKAGTMEEGPTWQEQQAWRDLPTCEM